MLVSADLVVLHLIKLSERRLAQRLLDLRHELLLVLHDFEKHFLDVLLDREQVGLDALLLEELDLLEHALGALVTMRIRSADKNRHLLRQFLEQRAENKADDLICFPILLFLKLLLLHVDDIQERLLAAISKDVRRALQIRRYVLGIVEGTPDVRVRRRNAYGLGVDL